MNHYLEALTVNTRYRPGPSAGIGGSVRIDGVPAERWVGARSRHTCGRPAFDLAIETCTAMDVDPKAAVIVLADIPPNGLRVVSLDRRRAEPARRRTGDPHPEPLGRFHVSGLVDVDAVAEVGIRSACRLEEAQEEPDQSGITVYEADAIGALGGTLSSRPRTGRRWRQR